MSGSVVAAASAGQIGGITIVCNRPTGTADGDVMVAFLGYDWGTHAESSAPAGWTLLCEQDQGSNNNHVKIWSKTASGEGSNYSFPQGAGANGCVSIVTTRGTTEAGILQSIGASGAGTSRVAPSLSGVAAGAVLLCYAMLEAAGTANTFTPPSGMNEEADFQPDVWASHSVASLLNPPNPTLTRTFTSSTAGDTPGGVEASIAIPATGGAPTARVTFVQSAQRLA